MNSTVRSLKVYKGSQLKKDFLIVNLDNYPNLKANYDTAYLQSEFSNMIHKMGNLLKKNRESNRQ